MDNNWNRLLIGGRWKFGSSDSRIEVFNPYDEELLFSIQGASVRDVDGAYRASRTAQAEWAKRLPQEKAEILERAASTMIRRKEEIINLLVKESGSTRLKAQIEWGAAYRMVKEAATFPFRMEGKILPSTTPGKENRVYRSPVGVVGVISPWNFPFHLGIRSIATALAAGNGVVVKPASETPVTGGLLIADIMEEAGLPEGLLSAVVGNASEIGDAFVTHPVPRIISFTGSTEVGGHVAQLAGKHLKKTELELGGNNALIVLDDADLEAATESAAFGKFLHQGQICMAINRIIVDQRVYDDFIPLFKQKVERLRTGDPADENTQIGPLINRSQLDEILETIDRSLEQGAQMISGGRAQGLILEPTILIDVTNEMATAKNEIFGPVANILRARDESEAIRIANETPYGLCGAVHTRDINRGIRVAKFLQTGMVHVNDQPVNDEPHVAFGGEKDSGIGRFGGEWILEAFTTHQWISVQEKKRDYPF